MLNLLYGVLILPFLVVITRDQIVEDIYVGMPEQEAIEYFKNFADSEHIVFRTISTPRQTVGHDIRENEIGYYVIYIGNVRSHWWAPSLGASYSIVLAISNERRVTEVKIIGARSGWP